MNVARWGAILALTISLVACVRKADHTQTTDEESNKVTKLIISKRQEGVAFPIGTLTFGESNKPSLTVEKPGADGDELKKNWEELSKLDHLTWKRAVPQIINGEHVTAIDGTDIQKSDKNYKWAVLDNLERKYNYTVDSTEK